MTSKTIAESTVISVVPEGELCLPASKFSYEFLPVSFSQHLPWFPSQGRFLSSTSVMLANVFSHPPGCTVRFLFPVAFRSPSCLSCCLCSLFSCHPAFNSCTHRFRISSYCRFLLCPKGNNKLLHFLPSLCSQWWDDLLVQLCLYAHRLRGVSLLVEWKCNCFQAI